MTSLKLAAETIYMRIEGATKELQIKRIQAALRELAIEHRVQGMRDVEALLPQRMPVDEDSAICSECASPVTVNDGCEWEDGDICGLCATGVVDELPSKIKELISKVK